MRGYTAQQEGRSSCLSEAPIQDTQVLSVEEIQIHIIVELNQGWLGFSCMRVRCRHNPVHVLDTGVGPPESALHFVHQSHHLAHLPVLSTTYIILAVFTELVPVLLLLNASHRRQLICCMPFATAGSG